MSPMAPSHVLGLEPYIPGRPIKETQREYGLSRVIKLASNENAWGPSPKAIAAAHAALEETHLYPNSGRSEVKDKIVAHHGAYPVQHHHLVLGNGSNELITLLARCVLDEDEILLNAWPSFMMYRLVAKALNRQEICAPLRADWQYDLELMLRMANGPLRERIKLVFIGNPNNPTGRYIPKDEMAHFLQNLPSHVVVAIDEAYVDYVTEPDYEESIRWVFERPRTVVLRTFSKIYGLAGLRIGYAIADPEIAEILHRMRDPFNVNSVAQAAAQGALEDHGHVASSRRSNETELKKVQAALENLSVTTTPSAGNFILAHLKESMPSVPELCEALIRRSVIVRPLDNYDLPRAFRVTVGRPEENETFTNALAEVLKH